MNLCGFVVKVAGAGERSWKFAARLVCANGSKPVRGRSGPRNAGVGVAGVCALLLAGAFGFAKEAAEVRTLTWDDLLPEGEVAPPQAFDHFNIATFDDFPSAAMTGTVEALDGEMVRLPGFVVPLDVTEGKVSSFLLVPYFGACIHQPPPPPNQIVHVTFAEPAEVESMYDPVWVTGRMRVESYSGLAEAGYAMDGRDLEPYEY